MDWTTTAILSAATLSVVNIIDSHLITKRMPSFRAFLLLVGVMHMSYALLLLYLFPLPENVGLLPILVAVTSGLLRTASVSIMLYSFKIKEVSQVIPVVYTYPIFVAMVAVLLLGESLHYLQWLAIVIVVVGVVMVSIERSSAGATRWLGKTFLLLLISSLCMALGDVGSKYALNYISFWNNYSITAICMSGFFWLISVRPHVLREIRDMERRNSSLVLMAFNETLAPVAILLSFWAIQRGPVSLVAAIIGSRPVFVTIYSLVLGRLFPDFLIKSDGKRIWLLRLVATVMIFSGIALIYLL